MNDNQLQVVYLQTPVDTLLLSEDVTKDLVVVEVMLHAIDLLI